MQVELHPEDEAFLREYVRRRGDPSLDAPLRAAIHLLRLQETSQLQEIEASDRGSIADAMRKIESTPREETGGREIDQAYFDELRARVRDRSSRPARRAR